MANVIISDGISFIWYNENMGFSFKSSQKIRFFKLYLSIYFIKYETKINVMRLYRSYGNIQKYRKYGNFLSFIGCLWSI